MSGRDRHAIGTLSHNASGTAGNLPRPPRRVSAARAMVYRHLEDIRFRTGVLIVAAVGTIVAAAVAAALIAGTVGGRPRMHASPYSAGTPAVIPAPSTPGTHHSRRSHSTPRATATAAGTVAGLPVAPSPVPAPTRQRLPRPAPTGASPVPTLPGWPWPRWPWPPRSWPPPPWHPPSWPPPGHGPYGTSTGWHGWRYAGGSAWWNGGGHHRHWGW